MDWAGLAELVAPFAPTLGRALGNTLPIPFGGSIGEAAGAAIAQALGVAADPNVVASTLQQTPKDVVQAQLADAEASAQAKFAAIAEQAKAEASVGTAQVQAVAQTIQAELQGGAWYQKTWRPAAMFMWVATWPVQMGTMLYPIWYHDPTSVAGLPALLYALAAWNAGPAALAGVYSWNRSQEKVAVTQAVVGKP